MTLSWKRSIVVALLGAAALALAGPRSARAEDWPKLLEQRLADVCAFFADDKKPMDPVFDSSFLKHVPEPQLRAVFADYAKKGGKVMGSRVLPSTEKTPALATGDIEIEFERGVVKGHLGLVTAEPHKVNALLFQFLEPRVATFD